MKRWTDDERPRGGCYDCGLKYGEPGWIEAIVPDAVWEIINPTYHKDAGLLCITCIARRCMEAGLSNVPVWFCGTEKLEAHPGDPVDELQILRAWTPKEPTS